ncbi:RND transporter [Arenibacter sp. M-2]|uniref:efflux RND transporter periplasmic adaptor subunit n=1 Tax=unclassified Arenibacter TaxID=2615047 RepID=UPI000D758547|nr:MULTISPECIES: RND transporter [unclassified Arenibacter]MDL5512321.1 RND transporter [Arenibacter sp. M-2]PXX26461.1 multidrug efflux pump subunit AcrA (membrane-fusion protein) [Arenibacter sp. ARW7G5Y1]|tara:strand:+ start:2254 stop:3498 length:1245 start_codon:yes stop_codon:yes gene_type:complete
MNKKKLLLFGIPIVLILAGYTLFGNTADEDVAITTKVVKGEFLNEVIISGEAQSTSLKKINGPDDIRKFKLRDVKIQDLIPEGSLVKEGDYVGRLDPSEVNEQILDAQLNLETAQSKYTQEQLDTTLTLKQERTAIKDLLFDIQENKLELKQSIYEPPATIKKLEINIERLERDLKEKTEDYKIKEQKAMAKMVEVGTEVSKISKMLEELRNLQKSFTIHSDANGMVTYAKNWDGTKRKVGSSISMWDPAIATLPDLTKMESKTYANEVDIRKIKKDLPVIIGFDAFPDVTVKGTITNVANVGEEKRGSDIKLFQVLINFDENNENVRPGMTTSNRILIHKEEEVLMIPLEAVFSQDSISFVYAKSGLSIDKKEIEMGESNLDVVIVKKGLNENEVVYLSKPEGLEEKGILSLN